MVVPREWVVVFSFFDGAITFFAGGLGNASPQRPFGH